MQADARARSGTDAGEEGPVILVTGAAGFLGSYLCERLVEADASVWGLDSFDDHYRPSVKRRNLGPVRGHPRMHLVQGDVRDRVLLDGLMGGHAFDAVVHLAALPGVGTSMEAPGRCLDVNVDGTLSVLEAAGRHGVGRLVFASSASVYGDGSTPPFHESEAADRPLSPHGTSKRAGEMLCHAFHRSHGLSVHCLRIFSAYGPRQRPELVVHRFARLMRRGEPVPLHGDGSVERDYVYVDDVVDGLRRSVERLLARPDDKPEYQVVNLGRGEPVRLDRLLDALAAALGVEPEIDPLPGRAGDMPSSHADTGRAAELLGWRARTSLEDGLAAFVRWLDETEAPGGAGAGGGPLRRSAAGSASASAAPEAPPGSPAAATTTPG